MLLKECDIYEVAAWGSVDFCDNSSGKSAAARLRIQKIQVRTTGCDQLLNMYNSPTFDKVDRRKAESLPMKRWIL